MSELDDTPGSRVPAGWADEGDESKEQEFRERMTAGVFLLLQGKVSVGDPDIEVAISTADRVIRKVERFCAGKTPPQPPASGAALLPDGVDRDLRAERAA